jgi:hypothetical protein
VIQGKCFEIGTGTATGRSPTKRLSVEERFTVIPRGVGNHDCNEKRSTKDKLKWDDVTESMVSRNS